MTALATPPRTAPIPVAASSVRLVLDGRCRQAVLLLDRHGTVLGWSEEAEGLLGWSFEDAVGGPDPSAVEGARGGAGLVQAVVSGGWVVNRPEVRRRKDGSFVHVSASAAPARHDASGEEVVAVVLGDLSPERTRASDRQFLGEALQALASSLDWDETLRTVARLAVERIGDWCSIDVVDEDGRTRAVEIAAVDPGVEVRLRELTSRYPPDPALEGDPVGAVLRSGEAEILPEITDDDLRAVARDPEHLADLLALAPRSMMIVPLVGRGGILGALTLFCAATERRFAEADLALARELADRAALAVENARLHRTVRRALLVRDEVVGIVAHDLRNPVAAIQIAAEMIRDDLQEVEGSQAAQRMTSTILKAARGMERLIDDLLDVARIETGTFRVEPRAVAVEPLLQEAAEPFTALAARAGLRLVVKSAAGLPAVSADVDRIFQVFSNLLGNALKFTAEGEIALSAAPDGEGVTFSVSDSGSGIPEAALPHVFDRFWQVRSARRAGAGLGLTICKGIVEAHGGSIEAESRPGAGTVFRFKLPLARARDAAGSRPR